MIGSRRARIEEVAQVLGGGTPSRQESKFFGGGIPWATPTDVTALDGMYISATRESITEEGLRSSSTKLLPVGAVLLTSRATIGFTAVAAAPICTNQGFVNFICGPDLLPEFLAYWLRTQKTKMLQHAGGTTFKEIARGTLRKFEIVLPEIDAQRRIVDLLARAEGIVRLRREAQQKAAELIPAIFIDMFGDPATNPKGWPMESVADVGRVQLGRQRTPKYQTGKHTRPYVRVANVHEDRIDVSDLLSMDFDERDFETYRLEFGDILLNEGQSIELVGRPAMWRNEVVDCCFQNTLIRFQADQSRVLPEYMLAALLERYRSGALSRVSSKTSNVAHLGAARFAKLSVMVPPLELQDRFRSHAAIAESVKLQQFSALGKARAAFDALLARAFH